MERENQERLKKALAAGLVLLLLLLIAISFQRAAQRPEPQGNENATLPAGGLSWNAGPVIATLSRFITPPNEETRIQLDPAKNAATAEEYAAAVFDSTDSSTGQDDGKPWDSQYEYTNAYPTNEQNGVRLFAPKNPALPTSVTRTTKDASDGNQPSAPILVVFPRALASNPGDLALAVAALSPLTDATGLDDDGAAAASQLASTIITKYYPAATASTSATTTTTSSTATTDANAQETTIKTTDALTQFASLVTTAAHDARITNDALNGANKLLETWRGQENANTAEILSAYRRTLERFSAATAGLPPAETQAQLAEVIDALTADTADPANGFFEAAIKLNEIETANAKSGSQNPQPGATATSIPGSPAATQTPGANKYYDALYFPKINPQYLEMEVSETAPEAEAEVIMNSEVDLNEPLVKFVGTTKDFPLQNYATVSVTDIGRTIKVKIKVDISNELAGSGVLPVDEINGDAVVGFFEIPGAIAAEDAKARAAASGTTAPETAKINNKIAIKLKIKHNNIVDLASKYGIIIGDDDEPTIRSLLDAIKRTSLCNPTYASFNPDFARTGAQMVCPVPKNSRKTTGWGPRRITKFHHGQDFAVPMGTPVKAPYDGVVMRAGLLESYCGNGININHGQDEKGDKLSTGYCHLLKILVKPGDTVKAGQVIAQSGGAQGGPGAGLSTGAHLHVSVSINDKLVNPAPFLADCTDAPKTASAQAMSTIYFDDADASAPATGDAAQVDCRATEDGPVAGERLALDENGCLKDDFYLGGNGAYPPSSINDLRGKPSLSVQNIQAILQQYNSPAAAEQGFAQCLYEEGAKAGIDPAFPLGFFMMESGMGKAGIARSTKGIGNVKYTGPSTLVAGSYKGFRSYATYCDSAKDWYRLIKDGSYYFTQGRYTLDTILPVYAPSNDGNNPAAYQRGVQSFISRWRGQETNYQSATKTTGAAGGSPQGQQIVATAKQYVGNLPYVKAGSSLTTGADCSGFTQAIFKKNGISILRTAATQFTQGVPVDRSQLQAGDLVFFSGTTDKPGITHVGISEGGCSFVHAPRTGKMVSEDDLCANSYYLQHYAGARRYVGPAPTSTTTTMPTTTSATTPPLGRTIVLDPGHGVGNPGTSGTSGKYNGATITEAEFNLIVAKRVGSILTSKGFKVLYTREDAYSPATWAGRTKYKAQADLFVSIHANGNGDGTRFAGPETYYWDARPENALTETDKQIAFKIQARLQAVPGISKGRGVLKHPVKLAVFAPYNGIEKPMVLVETAYMDRTQDMTVLGTDAGRQAVAQAIADGITDYYGGTGYDPCGEWHTHIITTMFDDAEQATGPNPGGYFASLPSVRALRKTIEVRGPNGKTLQMKVTDDGPMCVGDDAYVFGNARPIAEQHIGENLLALFPPGTPEDCRYGGSSTGAALDLSPAATAYLGLNGKDYADWRFVN